MRRGAFVVALAAALLGACGSFEDPSIVIDLRVLGVIAEPPEQVQPFDPDDPLATEFAPVEVCVLVADPPVARRLEWSMTLCPPASGRRCATDRPSLAMGSGVMDDPDATDSRPCATVPGSPAIFPILQDTIERDSVSGFGGIDLNVSLRVVGEGLGEDQAVYASKAVRYSPQFPAERVANTNPFLDEILVDRGDPAAAVPLPRGPCSVQATPLTVGPVETLHFMPTEPPGVRETYVIPTFEGGSREFTENLRYQWFAGGGDWTRGGTGGPRDGAGNQPELDTEWESPAAADLDGPTDLPLWIIQRDERGGQHWFESCVRVVW